MIWPSIWPLFCSPVPGIVAGSVRWLLAARMLPGEIPLVASWTADPGVWAMFQSMNGAKALSEGPFGYIPAASVGRRTRLPSAARTLMISGVSAEGTAPLKCITQGPCGSWAASRVRTLTAPAVRVSVSPSLAGDTVTGVAPAGPPAAMASFHSCREASPAAVTRAL